MSQPPFTLSITASVVAWYAALVSTITGAVQVGNFLRDRKKIKLDVMRNMVTDDPRRAGMEFTILRVTNAGRRPVNVTHIYLKQEGDAAGILSDVRPPLPHELTEGKQLAAYLDEARAGFETIRYFAVVDSTGREYKLKIKRGKAG